MRSMIAAVTAAEWYRWRRSWLRVAVLLLYLGAGAYAIVAGQHDVQRWDTAVTAASERAAVNQTETRAMYASGVKGPADEPWVDLAVGYWAEWYSWTSMGMRPQPLAVTARGVSDVRGHVIRVNRFTSAFDVGKNIDLGNPETQALGALDLVFVLTMLMPLVMLVFGFDLLSYEREQGIATVLHVQSASIGRWFAARLMVLAVIVLVPTVGLWLIGAGTSGAFSVQAAAVWQGAGFLSLLVLAWVAVVGAVGAWVTTSATSALTLACLWVAVTLIVPALANQVVSAVVPVGYASEVTNAVRSEQAALYAQPPGAFRPAVYAAFPGLRSAPYARFDDAADSLRNPDKDMFLREFAEHMLSRRAMEAIWSREVAREQLAMVAQWGSPTVAAQLALTRLAGVDAASHRAFEQAVVPVVRAKLAMLLDGEWNNRKYDVAAFDALVALVPPAARYGGTIGITSWVVLLTWLSAAIAVAVAGLRRPFLSPSPFARFSLDARLSQTTTVS